MNLLEIDNIYYDIGIKYLFGGIDILVILIKNTQMFERNIFSN